MKTTIWIAAGLGFLVPIVLGCVLMLLFNAPDSGWVHFVAYQLPYIVCPAWVFGDGTGFWLVAMPFANAATYAALAFLVVNARPRRVMGSQAAK